jgi:hypothetical protein
MFKRVLVISLLGFSLGATSVFAYSPEFEAGIQQARDATPAAKQQAQQVMKGFNPKEVFEHYDPQPEQAKLYGGITQANTQVMQQKANEKMANSDIAQTIVTSKTTRPLYQPNLKTSDMQRSLLIQSEADNIIRGVTSQYIDCQPKQSCQVQYTSKMCTRSAVAQSLSCRKNLIVNVIPPTIQESWSSSCNYLEQLSAQGICHVKEDKCLLPNATKTINDVAVTRACWEKQVSYDCQTTPAVDDCSALDAAQCEHTQSACDKKVGDVCLSYQQTYRCPQTACVNTANILCGDGKDYCLNGDCTDHSYQPSNDFGKVLTAMSATNESVKDFDTHLIFKGKPRECRDDAGNFSNCCQGTGWGQDINLAHCSQNEKELGASREKQTAVYVGRYCSSKILGKCIEHKETYCLFGSKIAKVIQEQGRRGQLHISFGDGKHANCKGITPDQLQRINLSRIDFGKEIMDELSQKLKNPNVDATKKTINERIQQYQQTGQSNE